MNNSDLLNCVSSFERIRLPNGERHYRDDNDESYYNYDYDVDI
jgi:hypothetical protein